MSSTAPQRRPTPLLGGIYTAARPGEAAPAEAEPEIEAGAAGDTLRLWQAREAMRHAELRLASQTSSLQAFEARAAALMGWIVTGVSALGGGAVVTLAGGAWLRAVAIGAGLIPAIIGAIAVSAVLWPKIWRDPGYTPDIVMGPCVSELQQLEFLVAGYARGIAENRRFLDRAGRLMRWGWWMLFAAPLTAAVLAGVTFAVAA